MKTWSNTLCALGALATLLTTAGCRKSAAQQQEEAEAAQRELTETRQQAQTDVDEAQRRAREAAAEVRGAPAVANANAVLAPDRGEYLRKHRDELASLDQKVAALEARAAATTGRAKAELGGTVRHLKEQRALIGQQLDAAGTIADATWTSFTRNLDKAVDDFKGAVARAPK